MRKNNLLLQRSVALLLALIMILSLGACQRNMVVSPEETPPPPSSTPTPTPTVPDDAVTFVPSHAYVLVYPKAVEGSELLDVAMTYLSDAMKVVYGIDVTRMCDSKAQQGQDTYEILIGDTNRLQSQFAMNGLGIRDYKYLVDSENVIVICGGSLATTREAVEMFCADIFGYRKGNECEENTAIAIGTLCTKRASYPYTGVTLNGAPLSDWTIVIDPNAEMVALADQLVRLFGYYTGERIKVCTGNPLKDPIKNVIVLGAIGRARHTLPGQIGDYYSVTADSRGCVISLFSTEDVLPFIVNYLIEQLRVEKGESSVSLSIPYCTSHYTLNRGSLAAWNLKSEFEKNLYDGVDYLEQTFEDEKGKPYHTYVLFLDPQKVSFHMGSSNDGYAYAPSSSQRQTTQQHMSAAVNNGKNIIAGINANFFRISSDYSPQGLALKDGYLISPPASDRPFFGVTYDGEVIIDYGDAIYTHGKNGKQFEYGVAGNEILVSNGLLTNVAAYGDQSLHPRTLVGIAKDGTVILGVIDGRQETHSNGAGYARCALWMRSLGAETVLNLDGGGSSNLILRDPSRNSYQIYNSPSDGQLRKVYNSLLIELKK